MRQMMDMAATADVDAIAKGLPAIDKLKLLPEVIAVLQKYALPIGRYAC